MNVRPTKFPVRIEPARPRDLPAIAAIDAGACAWLRAEYPARDYLPLHSRSADWFAAFANRDMAKLLVARTIAAREPVGYLLTLAIPMKSHGANLRVVRMAVAPAFHRMGIGRAMVASEGAESAVDDAVEFRTMYADVPIGMPHAAEFFRAISLPSVGISPRDGEYIRMQYTFPQTFGEQHEQERKQRRQ